MKYIIMILIIIGLAISDYVTGLIKACISGKISSKKMRVGGLNKLCEIIIMAVASGLDIGINALGNYYEIAELSAVTGDITAFAVFIYISVMEIVSIFENYAEINPDAEWALKIIKKLKNFSEKGEKNDQNTE